MDIFNQIQTYLTNEIKSVNDNILSHLSYRSELINVISSHLINAGGKRIRPILNILCFKMFSSEQNVNIIKLSTAIEFIHAATLLHDDVVDESAMRRFRPTANFIWGNKPTILVGDFLLSQAFGLLIEIRNFTILDCISNATTNLIEGEVIQLKMLEERNMLSISQYEKVITAKTAELFGAACKTGALLAAQKTELVNILDEFGSLLGKIFQITDDLLDYLGNSVLIGKNIGDDFFEGKITLPIILLSSKLNAEENPELLNMFKLEKRNNKQLAKVQSWLKRYNIENDILDYLLILQNKATMLVDNLPVSDSLPKHYLKSLIEFTTNRIY